MKDAPKCWYVGAVALLLVVHSCLLGYSAWCHSPVYNEVGHLASGLFTWQTGRFDLFRVNPPLVRAVAAAPVALVAPTIDWDIDAIDRTTRYEYDGAKQIMRAYRQDTLCYIRLARLICISFSLLGAAICWRWSTDLFGPLSGLIAMLLWCFSPFVLGHASLITADAHSAALGITAIYSFWRWLKHPTFYCAGITGFLLGLAILSKVTLLSFLPICFVLWYLDFDRRNWSMMRATWKRDLAMLMLTGFTCLFFINAGYLFRETCRPLLEHAPFASDTFRNLVGQVDDHEGKESKPISLLARIPIPLPKDFILGIDIQKSDFENGRRCYLGGQWQDNAGWWYFYIYALLVKVPLGTLGLFLLTLIMWILSKPFRLGRVDELALLLPPLTIFLLVSSQTGMTIHCRYLLPALPFIVIWTSRVGQVFSQNNGPKAIVVSVLTSWALLGSLYHYPHSLSYFNEIIGGPRNAGKHLLDSNVGWDQDLLFLKKWIEEHPEASPIQCVSLGLTATEIVGLGHAIPPFGPPRPGCILPNDHEKQLQLGPKPGWFAVDINRVYGFNDSIPTLNGEDVEGRRIGCDHSYFRFLEPVAMAGYSIYIYHITLDEANRVRRMLGLAELSQEKGIVPMQSRQ